MSKIPDWAAALRITPDGYFVGTADALVAADLVLPEWLPVLPRRSLCGYDLDGWWRAPDEIYSGGLQYFVRGNPHYWIATNHRVGALIINRVKQGTFAVRIGPLRTRLFLDGPIDPYAGARAVEWHRKMVRARRDSAFRRFLAKLPLAAEAAS